MRTADAISRFLTNVINDIIKEQRDLNIRDTGASAASLYEESTDEGGQIHAFQYLQTNFKGIGRKPGRMPPVDNLRGWTSRKAPNINPWALARKIANEGTAIYRGDKKGIDIAAIKRKHRPQFLKDSKRAIKDQLLYGINSNK